MAMKPADATRKGQGGSSTDKSKVKRPTPANTTNVRPDTENCM